MASKEEGSDAFNLLNLLYNDDEDDDMEDADIKEDDNNNNYYYNNNNMREPNPQEQQAPDDIEMDNGEQDLGGTDALASSSAGDSALLPQLHNVWTPQGEILRPSTPQLSQMPTPSLSQEALGMDPQKSRRERPIIVDYGHDEAAASPEPEDGEIMGNGRVMFGEELQSANADFQDRTPGGRQGWSLQSTPQPYIQDDALQLDNNLLNESDTGLSEDAHVSQDLVKDVDPLAKFLPPPPNTKCSHELQEKINGFLGLKRLGKSFNAEVRNRKGYRNPDFLQHAVRYQEVDEIGSCFSKDVFDPHGYDASDYYDAIEADMKLEMERKAQEKKKTPKVEFVSGGTQSAAVAAQKINLPVSGVSNLPSDGLQSAPAIPDVGAREGRTNKKSKWDKVDGDRRNTPGGGLDAVSSAGTHATLLTAANAGSGYAVFAQQKRREAEERRSSEKRVDRRS